MTVQCNAAETLTSEVEIHRVVQEPAASNAGQQGGYGHERHRDDVRVGGDRREPSAVALAAVDPASSDVDADDVLPKFQQGYYHFWLLVAPCHRIVISKKKKSLGEAALAYILVGHDG